jgi:hypothetical protein
MIKAGQYLHAGAADDDVVLMLGTSTKLVHCIVVAADGITILADSFHGNMVSATDYKIADEDAAQFIPKIPNNTIFVLDSKTVLEFHTQYLETGPMRADSRFESEDRAGDAAYPHPRDMKVGDSVLIDTPMDPRFTGMTGTVAYVDKNGLTVDLGLDSGYRPVMMQGDFKRAPQAAAYPERRNVPIYNTGRNVNDRVQESGSLFTITSRDTGAILKVAGTAEDIQHYEDMGQNVSYTLYAPNKHKGESRRRYAQGSYDSPKVTPAKAQSTALRWLGGDLKAEAAPAQNIDHNEYPRRLCTKSTAELKFAQSDAQAAMKAMPDGPKAGYYADEINYISMELARRAKGGK